MKTTQPTWRDRHGNLHHLDEMGTGYLYNTVKCLWNNVAGRAKPFGEVIEWDFDPENYPQTYLTEVFHAGLIELRGRRSSAPEIQEFLNHVTK